MFNIDMTIPTRADMPAVLIADTIIEFVTFVTGIGVDLFTGLDAKTDIKFIGTWPS